MSRKTDTDIRAGAPVDLAVSRERIDAIDARIIELFERMRVAADVAAYKRTKGLAVLDREREARKIESVRRPHRTNSSSTWPRCSASSWK